MEAMRPLLTAQHYFGSFFKSLAEMGIGSHEFLNAKGIAQWPGQIRLARFFQRIK